MRMNMFVSLCTSDDRSFLLSLAAAIKKQYSLLPVSVHDVGKSGLQLRLESYADENKAEAFVRGFTAAWEQMENKIQKRQSLFDDEEMP